MVVFPEPIIPTSTTGFNNLGAFFGILSLSSLFYKSNGVIRRELPYINYKKMARYDAGKKAGAECGG